jgi:hypothetical protein
MRSVQGIQSFVGVLVQALIADRLQRRLAAGKLHKRGGKSGENGGDHHSMFTS